VINLKASPCAEGVVQSTLAARNCIARQKPWILAVAILASSIAYIDESVVNVALPAIETDLGASAVVVQWLVNAYTLCLSALLLVGGAAGDRFGRRLIFVIGTGVFGAASLWCTVSPNVVHLILARGLQGMGAALLIPSSLAIIGASFDESERGKAIGTWAGVSAVAAALGPLLGGWIVDHFSWRLIFLINPPLAVLTIWIALSQVPESRDPEANQGMDWRGALLALIGLGSLAYGLIAMPTRGASDSTVVVSLSAGTLLLLLFVWEESRSGSPMLPLGLFRSRTFSAVNLLTLLLYAALGGTFFFLPFALIEVQNYPATSAGAVFLPFTIIMGALSRWSGGLLDRFGARLPLVIGPTISGDCRHRQFILGFPRADRHTRTGNDDKRGPAHDHRAQRSTSPSDRCCVRDQQRGRVGGKPFCGCRAWCRGTRTFRSRARPPACNRARHCRGLARHSSGAWTIRDRTGCLDGSRRRSPGRRSHHQNLSCRKHPHDHVDRRRARIGGRRRRDASSRPPRRSAFRSSMNRRCLPVLLSSVPDLGLRQD
jgi:MFS family permease